MSQESSENYQSFSSTVAESNSGFSNDHSTQYQSFENEGQLLPQSTQYFNAESFNQSSWSSQTSSETNNQTDDFDEFRLATQDFYITSQDIFSNSQFVSSQNTVDEEK